MVGDVRIRRRQDRVGIPIGSRIFEEKKRMNILVSPHADDELIGAYSLIKSGQIDKVVYLDTPPERFKLAERVGDDFGFMGQTIDIRQLFDIMIPEEDNVWFIPDIMDSHLLHKAANCIGRLSGCRLGYFTINMNTGYIKELSAKDKEEKRAVLNKYYPDQSSLWENDWKYFLFEGVVSETI